MSVITNDVIKERVRFVCKYNEEITSVSDLIFLGYIDFIHEIGHDIVWSENRKSPVKCVSACIDLSAGIIDDKWKD